MAETEAQRKDRERRELEERKEIQKTMDKEIAERNSKWGHITSDTNWWSR